MLLSLFDLELYLLLCGEFLDLIIFIQVSMLFEQGAKSQTAAVREQAWLCRAALFSGLLAEILPILPGQTKCAGRKQGKY